MENDNSVEKFHRLDPFLAFLIYVICVIWLLLFFFVLLPPNQDWTDYSQRPLSFERDVGLDEVLGMGREDHDHENLLSQIRKDLKIPKDEEIKIFVGPYLNIFGEGQLVGSNHPFGFILLLDDIFYQDLTPEEKTALISHELGHLTNEVIFIMYNPDTPIRFQIEADTYSTKYVRPEAMISVLNKANVRHGGVPSR